MGCGASTSESSPEDKEINAAIRADAKALRQSLKLLILGAGESGKSTICKQIMMIHNQFTQDMRTELAMTLKYYIVFWLKLLLQACSQYKHQLLEENTTHAMALLACTETPLLDLDNVVQYEKLYNDPAVQCLLERRNRDASFAFPESSLPLFRIMRTIAAPDYIPSDEDCLLMRLRTSGVHEYTIYIKSINRKLVIVDVGGQRNERRKWVHCFDGCSAIIYCIALDDYAATTLEDAKTSRHSESLKLFQDVVSLDPLADLPLIILFNRVDLVCPSVQALPAHQALPPLFWRPRQL